MVSKVIYIKSVIVYNYVSKYVHIYIHMCMTFEISLYDRDWIETILPRNYHVCSTKKTFKKKDEKEYKQFKEHLFVYWIDNCDICETFIWLFWPPLSL